MESPFAAANTTFTMYLEPIRMNFNKTYQNIITISTMPPGPLADMVKPMSFEKLSPFQQRGSFYNGFGCTNVLLRYPKQYAGAMSSIKTGDYFMTTDDIPSVLSYLQTNGYTVDTNMTKLMFKSRVPMGGVSESRLSGDRRMICMVNYTTL
jgi:hypothetical protein